MESADSAKKVEPGGVVLLVDDNAAFVDNLSEILEDAGYTARRALRCAEARTQAATGFAVALIDLQLPDGDGTELARELKQQNPDAQLILLTGHASTESAAAALRAGAFAYLVKPTPAGDLLLTVAQAMHKVHLVIHGRELARRAHRAEKLAAVGTLAAGLSHEIKNPLNAATLQLLVLERRLKRFDVLPADVFEPLHIVQDEIKRLTVFLDEFLQFSRPRELARASTDLAELANRVIALLRPQAAVMQVSLEARIEAAPHLDVDAARLQQALMNLILNALQAAPAGGWTRVELTTNQSDVVISVEDNGPGIAEAVRERVFEPFFTTKDSGTGLGLPTVHGVIQQHEGTLMLEHGKVGGARFVIRLPIDPIPIRPS